jgi:hypothetical protein
MPRVTDRDESVDRSGRDETWRGDEDGLTALAEGVAETVPKGRTEGRLAVELRLMQQVLIRQDE